MRHGSDILDTATYVRDCMKIGREPILECSESISILSKEQMLDALHSYFTLTNTEDNKVIAYTNNTVNKYNEYIRSNIMFEQSLMGSAYSNAFPSIGEHVVINNYVGAPIDTTGIVRSITKDYRILNGIDLDLISIETDKGVPVLVAYPSKPELYKEHLSLLDKEEQRDTKMQVADLRPHYAQTTFKAQGSTYDNVFIDLADINKCTKPLERLRHIYVALTRAKYNVFIYGG
jgi:exodeoxyribonuclease-5